MPENTQNKATLVSVGDHGELVFSAHGSSFVVQVDDALEHAILEAKQIKAERVAFEQPSTAHTLPISQIQALIRAGAQPAKVAERYGMSAALVRRFASSVLTERQYAIEQFLAVPAPKESRMHTVAELVERSLAAAQIGMEDVDWTATRRGLEPWRVTARFDSAGRHIRADWSWNMHDNAILPINPTAQRLIGESGTRNTAASATRPDDAPTDGFLDRVELPGNSVRSARIQRAVSAWSDDPDDDARTRPGTTSATPTAAATTNRRDTPSSGRPGGPASTTDTVSATNEASRTNEASQITPISAIARRPFSRHHQQGGGPATIPVRVPDASRANATPQPAGTDTTSAKTAQPVNGADPHAGGLQTQTPTAQVSPTQTSQTDGADDRQPHGGHEQDTSGAHAQKRRSGRCAVPSWDEILFGE
ncbi:septation protein SepH [Bifidobacterium mongoliense]|uniref:septation protein SepH n=1 Tax=Bifidobacterium mongoliense TaxID=518643 RepID=UPI0030F3C929